MNQLIFYSEHKCDYTTEILAINIDTKLTGENLYALYTYIQNFLLQNYASNEALKWKGYDYSDPNGKYTFTYEEFDHIMDQVLEGETYYLGSNVKAPEKSGGYLYPTSIKAILRFSDGVSLSYIVAEHKN